MRKLACAALAFSAAVFAANYILPIGWLIVPAVLCAVGGAALVLPREKWLRPVIICLLAFSLGLLNYYVQYQLTAGKAEKLAGETMTFTARLTGYPVTYTGCSRADAVIEDETLPHLGILIYDNSLSIRELIPGQKVTVTGTLKTADTYYGESSDYHYSRDIYLKVTAKGDIDVSGGFDIRSVPAYINHAVGEKISKAFTSDIAAFMKALLLGDKRDFNADIPLKARITRAGFSHIIAVSGMHVAFVVGVLQLIFGKSRRNAIACISLVWLFVLVTGASPSAVRAAVMQTVLLMAPVFYRENDPITSISAALALILLRNPLAAKSLSLQFSFAAMAGIILFTDGINERLLSLIPKRLNIRPLSYVLGVLSASLAVMVFMLPLTAVHFGYFQLLSVFTNILALWAVSACFIGGWIACALSAVPLVGSASVFVVSCLARYIFTVAGLVASSPYSLVYTQTPGVMVWIFASYAIFAGFAFIKRSVWIKLALPCAVSLSALCIILAVVSESFSKTAAVTAVDVGQGLCVAAISDDYTVVVDCGSSSGADAGNAAAEYLYSRGRKEIDVLALTHLHADHANGAALLMENIPVRTLVISENAETDDSIYKAIQSSAKRHGTDIVTLSEDSIIYLGNMTLSMFVMPDSGDENENCMIAEISMDKFDALVTGDSSSAAEEKLINTRDIADVELLVVGHHGSKYSSGEYFLRNIGGDYAIISSGFNVYGHPHEETLARLKYCGYNIFRTDTDGTIEMRIENYGKEIR